MSDITTTEDRIPLTAVGTALRITQWAIDDVAHALPAQRATAHEVQGLANALRNMSDTLDRVARDMQYDHACACSMGDRGRAEFCRHCGSPCHCGR